MEQPVSRDLERGAIHKQPPPRPLPPPQYPMHRDSLGREPYPMDGQGVPRTLTSLGVQDPDLQQSSVPAIPSGNQSWTHRVLEGMTDMLLLLGRDGRIMYASPSSTIVVGYEPSQLERTPFARFIHKDDEASFTQEVEECAATDRPFRCYVRFLKADDRSCILELLGHSHMTTVKQGDVCCGIFLVCRPYPSRSAHILNSFLEHKIENVRLNQRIAQLKAEEEEESLASQQPQKPQPPPQQPPKQQKPSKHAGPSKTHTTQSTRKIVTSIEESSFTQTREEGGDEGHASDAEEESSGSADETDRPILEQLGLSHIDGVEVMTGLYYGEGERSQGLSTGIRQGHLVNRDRDTPEQQVRSIVDPDRRKKLRSEYMCTDCGTSDSPEWRKGPEGPKTLCNACGLRWAKKEKRRQDS